MTANSTGEPLIDRRFITRGHLVKVVSFTIVLNDYLSLSLCASHVNESVSHHNNKVVVQAVSSHHTLNPQQRTATTHSHDQQPQITHFPVNEMQLMQ